jgi:hypothetical protein
VDGDWLLINAPNFPGGEQLEDGQLAYTLGRLAFNMFQPAALKLVIEQVSQPVFPVGKLEILYLDENLRITKGERGTVLLCEKR